MRPAYRDYIDRDCKLELLAEAIEKHFKTDGYETQAAKREDGWLVQAKKGGALRELLAADRAFLVMIIGGPRSFRVTFGIGKWMQDLGVAVVGGMAIAPVVFFVDIPISLWSYDVEHQFWSVVEKHVALRV